jgi:hypothetical protein
MERIASSEKGGRRRGRENNVIIPLTHAISLVADIVRAFMSGPPAGSSDPKTSIGQSVLRRSSQKRHVVRAESASSGSAAAIVSAT